MSKALVIKGANFAVNKVETITLSNPIPCEGIVLSQNTISASALGVAATLTATLTPADTTDQVVWTSSDEDVATVNNGVVTVVGVGTATITAACGTQSATCALTCEVVIILSDFVDGYQFTSTDLSYDPPKNYASVYPYAGKGRIYASEVATPSGIKAFTINPTSYPEFADLYPIMMPKNTEIIEVNPGIQSGWSSKIYMFDSTNYQTYVDQSAAVINGALVTQYTSLGLANGKYTFNKTAEVADSFAFQLANESISSVQGSISVTFKAS